MTYIAACNYEPNAPAIPAEAPELLWRLLNLWIKPLRKSCALAGCWRRTPLYFLAVIRIFHRLILGLVIAGFDSSLDTLKCDVA